MNGSLEHDVVLQHDDGAVGGKRRVQRGEALHLERDGAAEPRLDRGGVASSTLARLAIRTPLGRAPMLDSADTKRPLTKTSS